MHRHLSAIIAAVMAACGSGASPSPAPDDDVSFSFSDEAGAELGACQGTTDVGILGTWSAEGALGVADGTVPVKRTYRFCGAPSEGTFRYQEGSAPSRGCRRVADLRGTFTFDGTRLLLTFESGSVATVRCDDGDLSGADTERFEATVEGGTLTMVQAGKLVLRMRRHAIL